MGAKPRKTTSAGKSAAAKRAPAKRTPAKRAPAKRVPARKATATRGATAKRAASAPAGGKTVEGYVSALSGWQKDAAARLRDLILAAAPGCSESIKWGQPVYEENGPFCYFKGAADHLTFGFWRGTELEDLEWRLEGDGDRMKHLKIRSADEVTELGLAHFVRQAVELNRRLGNPTRGASSAPVEETSAVPQPIPMLVPVEPPAAPAEGGNGFRDEY